MTRLQTYIVTEGFIDNLVVHLESVLNDLPSLSSGEFGGVNVGGSGKENEVVDSESWSEGEAVLCCEDSRSGQFSGSKYEG